MSLFKKLFGGEKQKTEPQTGNYNTVKKTDYTNFQDLLEQNAGLSFEKQRIFSDTIGQHAWDFDMGKGTISFGDKDFPIQIIGSLAFNNNSWMWGWANTQSGMPENLLKHSYELKQMGEAKNIPEFVDGHFNVEEGFEHKIGMIACGLFKSKSYYCANYGQGTLVVTIDDDRIPAIDKNRPETITTNFSMLVGGMDLNHKNTFQNYLIDREFELNISENKIEGLRNNSTIMAEFDELDRLVSMSGKL
ncbi:hypothetical protein NAT51_08145 [Flavobacterium amniphilum]|uniref:DUF6882 domain-containing protein n=1 Tax=Flavobacterium amniphilum TaxID=1834035 RepID=UPI00202A19C1|nr:DUF6882 domain-containing protein [Flavobacterium amniphilum]MCL9805489.1 hypothetical protein [Flavobacterium amniphilum]